VDVDVTGETVLRCAACAAPLRDGDLFCERCGARSGAAEAADAVGGGDVRDRVELDLVVAAGVSDRGLVHRRNEDAYCLEAGGPRRVAAVVCDGISAASAGDVAAQTAARAALSVLAEGISNRSRDGRTVTLDAIGAAQLAVAEVPWTTRVGRVSPSCTLVCALQREDEMAIGALGDSRAYWHDGNGTIQLTVDDSWAQEQVSEGRLSTRQAMRDPRSHAVTHWVGADAPARPPRVALLRPVRPGRLLLCTDGLWNYVSDPAELGALIDGLPSGASPAAVARALADTALERGGRDNITVVVIGISEERSNEQLRS
jgi:PPM family protein phosphatase